MSQKTKKLSKSGRINNPYKSRRCGPYKMSYVELNLWRESIMLYLRRADRFNRETMSGLMNKKLTKYAYYVFRKIRDRDYEMFLRVVIYYHFTRWNTMIIQYDKNIKVFIPKKLGIDQLYEYVRQMKI